MRKKILEISAIVIGCVLLGFAIYSWFEQCHDTKKYESLFIINDSLQKVNDHLQRGLLMVSVPLSNVQVRVSVSCSAVFILFLFF
jgi:hypothetical protein